MFLDIQECFKRWNPHYWYRNDRLGTPRTLETGSGENIGKVVWTGVYDAFGNCQIIREIVENNLRFPGQYFDEETGLYYNLNRYYDPKTGRYLQTDPAGDGLNPYAYVGGNPVNAIDPNGLCAWRMVGGIADIGAGLLLTAKTGGIGLVVAWGIIINGADNLVAGAYSMIAGEEIPSLIQGGFRRAIPNRTAADLAYMGFEIGLNVAGLAVERAAQRAAAQDEFLRVAALKKGKLKWQEFKLRRMGGKEEIGLSVFQHVDDPGPGIVIGAVRQAGKTGDLGAAILKGSDIQKLGLRIIRTRGGTPLRAVNRIHYELRMSFLKRLMLRIKRISPLDYFNETYSKELHRLTTRTIQ